MGQPGISAERNRALAAADRRHVGVVVAATVDPLQEFNAARIKPRSE
jgi:hypothetical protein